MCQTLRNRNIPTAGAARPFTVEDFENFDLILTMDNSNYRDITDLDPSREFIDKVKKFSSFCQLPEHQISEVPDPYYGGDEGFELVADLLEDGCQEVLRSIQSKIHE